MTILIVDCNNSDNDFKFLKRNIEMRYALGHCYQWIRNLSKSYKNMYLYKFRYIRNVYFLLSIFYLFIFISCDLYLFLFIIRF